jgi:hypothetical protein
MKTNRATDLIYSQKDVDRLIIAFEVRIRALEEQKDAYIVVLEARITELEKSLNAPLKTSKNSSSRPSSDYKPNKFDGHNIQKKKRTGHAKGGRNLQETPSQTFEMKLTNCPDCGGSLEEEDQHLHAAYDKVDLYV